MNLLPKEIIPTVLCYVVCGDYEDEDSEGSNRPVDVAICNPSGYLLEIYNKKIINSCYILMEDASRIQIYYKFTEDGCRVYYLVKNNTGFVVVVKKCDNALLVVKCFRNVKHFKIFDYENKGYPQIGMHYLDSDKIDVIELSEFDNVKISGNSFFSLDGRENSNTLNLDTSSNQGENESSMEVDQILHAQAGEKEDSEKKEQEQEEQEKEEDKSVIKEYLSNKLKGMENFQNELTYELDNLNSMLNNELRSEYSFPAATFSANTVSSEKVISIKSTKTWTRIHSCKWIIGIEFWRFGIRNVDDIKVFVRNRDFCSCTYKFFETSDSKRKTAQILPRSDAEDAEIPLDPPSKSILIIALEIPDFGDNFKLSVGFTLVYEKYQHHTETFHLGAEDLFNEKHNFFHDRSENALSEDVLASLLISRNIDLTVEMRYDLGVSLEDVLSQNLGFKEAKVLGRNYFIKENGHLDGTLVTFDRSLDNFIKWKLSIAVKDLPRLKIFVKALSNELPRPLRIRIDQRKDTDRGE